jgi:hypothetical protein
MFSERYIYILFNHLAIRPINSVYFPHDFLKYEHHEFIKSTGTRIKFHVIVITGNLIRVYMHVFYSIVLITGYVTRVLLCSVPYY